MRRGEVCEIDERFRSEFQESYERFGNLGQRVLGFASLELPEDQFGAAFDDKYQTEADKVPTSGLVFVGLVSLVDPPKESVPQAVLDCHAAGIKVRSHPAARHICVFVSHAHRAVRVLSAGCSPGDHGDG
jgi:sodium/potassium-transporting ATPase subunit alpha